MHPNCGRPTWGSSIFFQARSVGRRLGPALVAACIAAALVPATGCKSPPRPIQYETAGDKPRTSDGLYRVRNTQVGGAFVMPEADFKAYDKVVFDPVSVAYKKPPERPAVVPARQSGMDRTRGNFELDEAGMDRLVRIYHEYVEYEVGKSDVFTIVESARPGVLRVSGHIVNLVVNVPPVVGGEKDYVDKGGEITVILDVRDAQTNEPLTRIVDRRPIRPGPTSLSGGYESTPVTNWGALRDISSGWGRQLRNWLEDLRAVEIPPAPPLPAVEAQVE